VRDGRFADAARAARARLFPKGLERVAEPVAANPDGVRVLRCTVRFERLGLRKGDLIVAIDGYRVHDLRQYRCLRGAGDGSYAKVRLLRNGQYLDATAPRRGLSGLYFENYPKVP